MAALIATDELDLILAKYDVIGNLAHAKMLHKIGLLTTDEIKLLEIELNAILKTIEAGTFTIEDSFEDVHSKVEYLLTEKLEKEIVSLLENGDKKAIAILYENYSDALYGVIKKIIRDDDTAQDVLQESFVKIWRYSKKYDSSKAKLFTWLYRIAYNTAIDKVRSLKNKDDNF